MKKLLMSMVAVLFSTTVALASQTQFIADVKKWQVEEPETSQHAIRWKRVLYALGAYTPKQETIVELDWNYDKPVSKWVYYPKIKSCAGYPPIACRERIRTEDIQPMEISEALRWYDNFKNDRWRLAVAALRGDETTLVNFYNSEAESPVVVTNNWMENEGLSGTVWYTGELHGTEKESWAYGPHGEGIANALGTFDYRRLGPKRLLFMVNTEALTMDVKLDAAVYLYADDQFVVSYSKSWAKWINVDISNRKFSKTNADGERISGIFDVSAKSVIGGIDTNQIRTEFRLTKR